MVRTVAISKQAKKDIRSLPKHIVGKLRGWIAAIETQGLEEARKVPGYHDEPLKGERYGQRSIRLSIHYRAIYILDNDGNVEFVNVKEVGNHGY